MFSWTLQSAPGSLQTEAYPLAWSQVLEERRSLPLSADCARVSGFESCDVGADMIWDVVRLTNRKRRAIFTSMAVIWFPRARKECTRDPQHVMSWSHEARNIP